MEQQQCRRCKSQTLAGQTNGGRSLALDVVLDLEHLDPVGELGAIVAGCHTWTVHHGMRGQLDAFHRDARTILSKPAGTMTGQTVHADHVCGQGEP